jgi:protein-tyrosine phosphatase
VIDLHTHILPGVDDGPPDVEGSVALAKAALAAGTRAFVATPHIDHEHAVTPATIPAAVRHLRAELDRRGVPLVVHAGAEIAPERLPQLDDDVLRGLAISLSVVRWAAATTRSRPVGAPRTHRTAPSRSSRR